MDAMRQTPSFFKRLLRRVLGKNAGHDKIEELCALTGRGEADKRTWAFGAPKALYLLKKDAPVFAQVPISLDGTTPFHAFGTLTCTPAEPAAVRDCPLAQVLDASALQDCVLRFRQNGDKMRPLGCGERLLSDVLTDKKIPAPLRDRIPLVCREDRVLWAVGIGIAEEAKLTEKTKQALRLEWQNHNINEQLGGNENA
jgi:tRNA(Ile)-lysidine synthetase, C-terminal domain